MYFLHHFCHLNQSNRTLRHYFPPQTAHRQHRAQTGTAHWHSSEAVSAVCRVWAVCSVCSCCTVTAVTALFCSVCGLRWCVGLCGLLGGLCMFQQDHVGSTDSTNPSDSAINFIKINLLMSDIKNRPVFSWVGRALRRQDRGSEFESQCRCVLEWIFLVVKIFLISVALSALWRTLAVDYSVITTSRNQQLLIAIKKLPLCSVTCRCTILVTNVIWQQSWFTPSWPQWPSLPSAMKLTKRRYPQPITVINITIATI